MGHHINQHLRTIDNNQDKLNLEARKDLISREINGRKVSQINTFNQSFIEAKLRK
jgi:hypothetical protein